MNISSIPGPESLDAETVLDCYEQVCLPAPPRRGRAEPAANLLALVDSYDAFILDGYGVLNLGPATDSGDRGDGHAPFVPPAGR